MRTTNVFAALLLFGAVVAVSACSRTAPVYNVQDRPIPVASQRLTLDEIGRNIVQAGRQYKWRMDPVEPGRITGVLDDRQHEAVIDIFYTQQAYSITLVESRNLQQEGDEVHKKYNKWIRRLEQSIDERLYAAGFMSR
jgi:hypothetical protein